MATEVWMYQERRLADLDLSGFDIEARDGPIGRVVRSLSSADGAFLIIDPGASMPLGRHVLVPAGLVDTVDLDDRRLLLRLSRDQVRGAPEYQVGRALDPASREAFSTYFASSSQSQSRSRRSPGRASAARRSTEKTRDELYDEAKRLEIEGRSKMSKAELARAVEKVLGRTTRNGSARANPVEVQKFLEGVGYPVRKGELVAQAKSRRAKSSVRDTLERLPDKRFKSPTEVSEAIGRLR
jgi:Protein of unknown function (DUF2795)